MDELSENAARVLLREPVAAGFRVPPWFIPEHIAYLFPVNRRPATAYTVPATPETPSTSHTLGSPDEAVRTSKRRHEDEARRLAMHTLVTSWEKSAKSTARELVNALFRGFKVRPPTLSHPSMSLVGGDVEMVSRFLSLIPGGHEDMCREILGEFAPSQSCIPRVQVASIGGYSVTETVGPLALLTRLCRDRTPAIVWVKDAVRMSHGRRTVRIVRREGRIVLFDRYMNLVFVPLGNASDNWQLIRGAVVALVQVK